MANIFASSVIEAQIDQIWKIIRNFNSLSEWHPLIKNSNIEDNKPQDKIGCIRNFIFEGGGTIREQLLALSDLEYFYTYSILESQMPIKNYVATIHLLPISDKAWTYIEWKAEFQCLNKDEDNIVNMIKNDVFDLGFDGLRKKIES